MPRRKRNSGPDANDGQKKNKSVLIFVSAEAADKMGEISKKTGLKRHELVTEAVNDWIAKNPKKPIPSIKEVVEGYVREQSVDAILLAREEAELAALQAKVERRKKKVSEF